MCAVTEEYVALLQRAKGMFSFSCKAGVGMRGVFACQLGLHPWTAKRLVTVLDVGNQHCLKIFANFRPDWPISKIQLGICLVGG